MVSSCLCHLQNLLHGFLFIDRRSAHWADQPNAFTFIEGHKVVVAILVEHMSWVASKLLNLLARFERNCTDTALSASL